jgi:hypothetical protein
MRGFAFLLLLSRRDFGLALCSLCGQPDQVDTLGVDGLVNPTEYVDSKGKMCAQLMIELFGLSNKDPKCIEEYNRNHVRCCKRGQMPSIIQDPPPPPPQYVIDGPYKRCDLCLGGGYPGVSSMVINMLYVGAGSCPQYYEWGQKGWIQDRLCQTLQFFARDPCGCASPDGRDLKVDGVTKEPKKVAVAKSVVTKTKKPNGVGCGSVSEWPTSTITDKPGMM